MFEIFNLNLHPLDRFRTLYPFWNDLIFLFIEKKNFRIFFIFSECFGSFKELIVIKSTRIFENLHFTEYQK